MTDNVVRTRFSRRLRWICGAVLLLLLALAVDAFFHAGNWLVREDPLDKARAIVVLSGGLPARALGAAEIYRWGYAREVWLTAPAQPSASMEELKLPYAGEEEYSRMVLISKGVPTANIRILKNKIGNTEDELHNIAQEMNSQPGVAVIVVTSRAHTRRVRALWNRVGNPRGRLIVRAANEDYFDPQHWWRTTTDALTVVREYLGLFNAWAGLPLHHSG
jgi:uncharacterized SAM-binding protein YcdF (DUF218 family)